MALAALALSDPYRCRIEVMEVAVAPQEHQVIASASLVETPQGLLVVHPGPSSGLPDPRALRADVRPITCSDRGRPGS